MQQQMQQHQWQLQQQLTTCQGQWQLQDQNMSQALEDCGCEMGRVRNVLDVLRRLQTAGLQLQSAPALQHGYFGHVLMNLPASALTFLDVFVGAFHRGSWAAPLPTVHCYCFSKAEDPEADVVAEAERVMGCKLPGASASVVRDVSPNKLMMCLRFTLPEEAWAPADDANGELPKRQRTDGGEVFGGVRASRGRFQLLVELLLLGRLLLHLPRVLLDRGTGLLAGLGQVPFGGLAVAPSHRVSAEQGSLSTSVCL